MDIISDIVVYENGEIELKISADKDTIWASINDIAKVFDIDRSVVSKHIKNIFKDNELDEKVVCAKFAHTTKHGLLSDKTQIRDIKNYIQNGYAINTHKIKEQRLSILENEYICK